MNSFGNFFEEGYAVKYSVQMSIKLPLGKSIVPEGNRSFIKECGRRGLHSSWRIFVYKLRAHHH